MLEQVERPFDKKIYNMCLFMVKEGQKMEGLLGKEMGSSLEMVPILDVCVKETMSKHYMKEVVTGMLIPVMIYKEKQPFESRLDQMKTNFSPVHVVAYVSNGDSKKEISFSDDYDWFNGQVEEFIYHKKEECVVGRSQLKRYRKIHHDALQYQRELLAIFQEGFERYQKMFENASVEENRVMKKVLRRESVKAKKIDSVG